MYQMVVTSYVVFTFLSKTVSRRYFRYWSGSLLEILICCLISTLDASVVKRWKSKLNLGGVVGSVGGGFVVTSKSVLMFDPFWNSSRFDH